MEEHVIENKPGSDLLLQLRGRNIFGTPNYRMVWSDSRVWFLGGQWRKKYPNIPPSWVIEQWQPPDKYGDRLEWAKNDLGPYPERGDYELAQASPNDVFANLSMEQAQRVIRAVEMTAALTIPQKLSMYRTEKEAELREEKRIIGDIVNDSKPAVHAKIPDHIERWDSFPQKSDKRPEQSPGVTGSYVMTEGEN